jgi:2-polyprenyl-6-methoxyphenol hydroxylase-like FAD-dependent oxidoreductase
MTTTTCIVGGGPAGMMLGYLLARAGVPVTVLEKHADFFRDFRGDTVHPSTLEVLYELDLLDDFLSLPHQKVYSAGAVFGDFRFDAADFRHVPARCKFVALMPQWDFLNFLSDRAKQFARFDLLMRHEAIGLTREGDRVTAVLVRRPDGEPLTIDASLVVACDGRRSTMRAAADMELVEFGVPIDVLWFRIDREPGDAENVLGNINYGKALILINRGDYFQAGLIIRKGSFEEIKQRGIEAFRHSILELVPHFGSRVNALNDWDQIKLLTVQINRLKRWYCPGLLCIGDAAHAMSPAGGVGINLAIQDAVATANLLTDPLREGCVSEELLAMVQARREPPTRFTQSAQVYVHRVFGRVFERAGPLHAPWQLKVLTRIPGIHRVMGHVVGVGVRPEHVRDRRRERTRRPRKALAIAVAAGVAVAFLARQWFRPKARATL